MSQSAELTCNMKLSGRRNSDYFGGVGFGHVRNTGRQTCTEVSQCPALRNHLTNSPNCSATGFQQTQNNSSCLKLLPCTPAGSGLYRLKQLWNVLLFVSSLVWSWLITPQKPPGIINSKTEFRACPRLDQQLAPSRCALWQACVTHGCDNSFPVPVWKKQHNFKPT